MTRLLQWLDPNTPSPFFFYDLSIVDRQVKRLFEAFRTYPKFEPFYAIKANNNPVVVKHVTSQGIGVHVSSAREMELAYKYTTKLSFTGPIISPQALEFATRYGVRINANSLYDAERLAVFGDIGLRINPGIGWSPDPKYFAGDPQSQFGVLPKEVAALRPKTLRAITGLHMHTSSDSFRIDLFLRALKELLAVAKTMPAVRSVNIGGGLGVPYAQHKSNFDMHGYAKQVIAQLEEFKTQTGRELTLQMEPGSFLVRQAGYYACQILQIVRRRGTEYYYSDGTTHHLRGQPLHIRGFLTTSTSRTKNIGDVYGSTCQRGDAILEGQVLPKLRPGDFVIVKDVGAYCRVQADDFNMIGTPPEVVVPSRPAVAEQTA